MKKHWNRMETWLTLMVAGIAVLVLGISGLWMYVSATATPLHPEANSVPSVTTTDPAQRWADAAQRARAIMRAALSEQNLPGLSVAIAVGDDLVWAEGFGFADLERREPVTPNPISLAGVYDLTPAGNQLFLNAVRFMGAIPEPSTWLMMLAGFFGLGLAVRAHRRRAIPA